MEQIGKVFRQLRESRNISLRQATGGQFSPSMLSRFETGQSELSVEKFLFALGNISASVEEILFLARGFQYDTDSELRKEITDVLDIKNIAPLEDLYRKGKSFMTTCFLPRFGESMNSICSRSVLPFYLFLFLLGMYEKWSANLIF